MVVVLGVLGEEGRWVKSGWDCRKVEEDNGDFQRLVGDSSVGKVLQLKRWVSSISSTLNNYIYIAQ